MWKFCARKANYRHSNVRDAPSGSCTVRLVMTVKKLVLCYFVLHNIKCHSRY